MKNEIQLVASFGIMLIMMLSNFGLCGVVGVWLSSFFFGIFGCVQYVMPVAFFLMVTVLLANDYSLLAMKKCGAGFVVLTMVSAYAQLICRQDVREFYDLFTVAATDRGAGGILGGGISLLLQSWFGTPGAIVIISCILLLALILLTQRSFVGFFRQGIARIRKAWKEAEEKRRQAARERATAQDKLREKQCEEKIKEMEEKKAEKEAASKDGEELQSQTDGRRASGNARRAAAKKRKQPDIRIHIPLFTPEDEVKKKDSLKELHPEIYPFTEEDGKTDAFNGSLDFSSLSLNEETARELFSDEPAGEKQDIFTAGFSETSPVESEEMTGSAAPVREECQTVVHDMDEQVQGTVSENKIQKAPEALEEETIQEAPKAAAGNAGKNAQAGSLVSGPADSTSDAGATSAQPASAPSNPPLRRQAKKEEYIFPPVNLLVTEKQKLPADYDRTLKETAMKLQSTLESFGVRVTITDISCGPTVTRYEMFPEQGTKVSKILSLTDDIKLNLAASDIRIEAPIPGKAAIGIEVPNKQNMTVHFRELIDNRVFKNFKSRLAFAVGKDIGGKIVVADLAKMPHLLIAGATGSGKSVCINTLIMSILYKARPTEVKLIMIDPKMVELSTYNGIPHLLIPVVTDPKKASGALNWAVAEMTDRYKKFTETGVRNIEGYNKKVDELIASGQVDEEKMNRMPQIVIIIDELADLMMVAPGEVEDAIVRLSQLARAAGIHLVIATQRPSVNVITGLIKANVPSRIAFSVSSGVDSRTIIDMNGAEKLLGKGDMLFYPSGYQKPVRVQGAFVSDAEVSQVVEFLKENEDVAVYDTEVSEKIENKIKNGSISSERDEYFEAAARFIMEKDKATIGMLQRMFKIGFNRAARIIDQLADAGIVGPEEGTKPRKILMSPEQLDAFFEENL
ncbi:DNA translocase FtsK [Eubacterium sp. An3]|uniref:DNA translocase FtsK n=1 Tax=Eubacterium sp. An3 TaxID=1965628 RepID=UPI001FA940E5|nr:DNA translocase FtsK [Eubacterium sp. An3]